MYLPAYIFEYRYLGLPWRAIVGGTTLAVGGETHRSPFKIAGMVLVAGIVTKMPLPILPAALASGAAVALWPAVQKFIKGMERRAERSRDKSSSSSKSTRCRDQCIQLCSRHTNTLHPPLLFVVHQVGTTGSAVANGASGTKSAGRSVSGSIVHARPRRRLEPTSAGAGTAAPPRQARCPPLACMPPWVSPAKSAVPQLRTYSVPSDDWP